MRVLSTASTMAQAFKNAGRVTEIVGVFVTHGFLDLLHRMKLSRFVPAKYSENPKYSNLPVAERLRSCFEQLGPTFVKLGQLLATRADLIPESFVQEFEKLQDNVGTVPFAELKSFLEAEFKAPLTQIFSSFEEIPIAAASIAQVHSAVLVTGERVAVKVQRPGIEKIIQNDVSILRGLADLLERYVPELKPFNPEGLVEEFFQTILYELDFVIESNNMRKIRTNLAVFPKVAVPIVYTQFSTSRVLVLERFDGVRFSERDKIVEMGIAPSEIVETGSDAFFHMVMHDGLFHGDLHAGNLFIFADGRIGIIDFGIVGRLSPRVRDSIITIFIALVNEDYETLASEYIYLCQSTGKTDLNALQKDLMDTIAPYMGLSLGEVDAGRILLRSTSIAVRHHLVVPRELMLLFRAMVTIEGLGKKLDPNFDMLGVANRLAHKILSTRYSKERVMRDLVVVGRDLQGVAETMPRLLRRFFRRWSANEFAFEVRDLSLERFDHTFRFFTYALVLSALALGLFSVGVALLFRNDGPTIFGFPVEAAVTLGIATSLLFHGLLVLRRRIR